jgi:excisionase family DNA binding protein
LIAIEGKTSHRSYERKGAKVPIHTVSMFAARQRLVLGQVKVAEKSNEIVAIPKLLDMPAIEGAIVTIDAMGGQRDIAQKIVGRNADYVLALKGNHGSLREDVDVLVADQKVKHFNDTTIGRHETVDADHGRIETRTTTVIHDVAWVQERNNWLGLKAVALWEAPVRPAIRSSARHATTVSVRRRPRFGSASGECSETRSDGGVTSMVRQIVPRPSCLGLGQLSNCRVLVGARHQNVGSVRLPQGLLLLSRRAIFGNAWSWRLPAAADRTRGSARPRGVFSVATASRPSRRHCQPPVSADRATAANGCPLAPPASVPKMVETQQAVPLLVSVKEARRLIGVGHTRIYALINDGSIETVRVRKRRLIRYSSLQRLAAASDK